MSVFQGVLVDPRDAGQLEASLGVLKNLQKTVSEMVQLKITSEGDLHHIAPYFNGTSLSFSGRGYVQKV